MSHATTLVLAALAAHLLRLAVLEPSLYAVAAGGLIAACAGFNLATTLCFNRRRRRAPFST